MYSFQNIILFLAVLFSGLVAGLLYSYSCSVNPGLKILPAKEYLTAMQSINRAIQNPIFFLSFMGLLLLFPLCSWFAYKQQINIPFTLVLAAALIYFIGVFAVTLIGNIPLNNQLENFNIANASDEEMAGMRSKFESSWVKWHSVRTIAAVISFGTLVFGLIKRLVS
jgi:uncharacterized membrane protein